MLCNICFTVIVYCSTKIFVRGGMGVGGLEENLLFSKKKLTRWIFGRDSLRPKTKKRKTPKLSINDKGCERDASHESYLIIIYKVSDAPGRSWYKGVSIENTDLEK